jgi:hypothetical protein
MPLTDRQRSKLELLGPQTVSLRVMSASGTGDTVDVLLGPDNPLRRDVEEWLAEKEREDGRRSKWMLRGAVVAAIAAIVAALAAISAAIEGAIQLLHSPG